MEVDTNKVIDELLDRIRQLEFENAVIKATNKTLIENNTNKLEA